MADISDVEQAVTDAVTSILYPQGPGHASIVGLLCRVYRGWPNSATLNADLIAGAVNVTVVTDNDTGQTTTRYLLDWRTTRSLPGVSASASGQSIYISGNPAAGDIIGALIDGTPYAYRIQTGDSPVSVAANLDRLIQAGRITSLSGSTIIVPGAGSVKVRVGCDQSTSCESRRQEKDLRVVCWCPSPQGRDSVAASIDAAMNQISFLPLPDGTTARTNYKKTSSYDHAQNALLYRRDLVYCVEYPTLATVLQPSMLFGALDLNSNTTHG